MKRSQDNKGNWNGRYVGEEWSYSTFEKMDAPKWRTRHGAKKKKKAGIVVTMKTALVLVVMVVLVIMIRQKIQEPYRDPHVPVYIINLKRRPDRLSKCLAQFSLSTDTVRVVEAIDGYDLETTAPNTITRGEVGCFLSHMKAVEMIAKNSAPASLVLEDDAVLDDKEGIVKVLRNAPKMWEVIALGCNSMPEDRMRQVAPGLFEFQDYDLYGAHALLYSRAGAAKVHAAMKRTGPVGPFDLWLTRDSGAKILVARPSLAHPRNLRDTETQKVR